ncbi:MAG: potassium transporter TrkG, partial [Holophaga sp.]|nr:potassium transporter TrkG [Holophaga sp.]
SHTLTPGLVFILSFALLILLGTLLLKTPQATTHGISWIDALFLSTSAVCVTGLSPVDISTVLTSHGQWVLLGLIQIGGLGVMTITYFFAYFMAGGMTLRSRIGLQDLLSEDNLSHIGMVLALIIGFTAAVEGLGAILIHASIADGTLPEKGRIFFSLFHSVSAFCNAGFSTLGAGLADPRVSLQKDFLAVIMALIVMGGLGFPVVKGFYTWISEHVRFSLRLTRKIPSRLSANSRIVLWTTSALLVIGTICVWLTEFAFAHGEVAGGSAWFTALFHSVTARTAGYNITDTGALLPATAAILVLLMFVGGSPSSTAGGIKTSTLAVAILSLRRVLLGRK